MFLTKRARGATNWWQQWDFKKNNNTPFKMTTAPTTAILPSKFERGDFTIWLRECADTNGWNADVKIKKLPAFLRGEAASHFYALDDDSRKSDATKALKEALCPPACKKVYYAEFESRVLNVGEDPRIYKGELEKILYCRRLNPTSTRWQRTHCWPNGRS